MVILWYIMGCLRYHGILWDNSYNNYWHSNYTVTLVLQRALRGGYCSAGLTVGGGLQLVTGKLPLHSGHRAYSAFLHLKEKTDTADGGSTCGQLVVCRGTAGVIHYYGTDFCKRLLKAVPS